MMYNFSYRTIYKGIIESMIFPTKKVANEDKCEISDNNVFTILAIIFSQK